MWVRILHWVDIFTTQVYINGDDEIGLRSLKGYVDPRACGCRGVKPCSKQLLSMTVYPFKDQGGEECSDSLASLTRSWLARLVECLTCEQKVVGLNPTLGRYFSTHIYFNGDEEKSGLRLKGYVDPRACGCSSVGRNVVIRWLL